MICGFFSTGRQNNKKPLRICWNILEKAENKQQGINWASEEIREGIQHCCKHCYFSIDSLYIVAESYFWSFWVWHSKNMKICGVFLSYTNQAPPQNHSLFCWNIEVLSGEQPKLSGTTAHMIHGRRLTKKKKELTNNSPQNTNHLFHLHSFDREMCFWIIHHCIARRECRPTLWHISSPMLLSQSHLIKCI